MAIDEIDRKRKEREEGDRWAGQKVSSPKARNMLGLHLLPSTLPESYPSLERVQMVFLSLCQLPQHGLPGC